MNINRIQGLAIAASLILPYFATAQSVQSDLRRTLKLKQYLTIEDLTDEYMAIKIGIDSLLGMMGPYMYMDTVGEADTVAEQVERIRYFDARWTKGDVVEIGGTGYLVTYQTDAFEVMVAMEGEHEPSQGLALHLDLVNLDNIMSIKPLADLTPEKYGELFGDLFADVSRMNEEMVGTRAQTTALSNIRQVSTAMMIYATDYDDITPYAQSTRTVEYLIYPYMKNFELWNTLNPNGSRFLFNMAVAGVNIAGIPDPVGTVMFYESHLWPDGRRLVSFMDTHARFLTEEEWNEVKGSLKLKLKRSAVPLPADYGLRRDSAGRPIPPPG
ncbi:MAG: hypothetical protein IH944_12560 [Armatimonadetes bacterium]|nr:hypothetical protein [Armatimonadota bacterium]